MTERRLMAALSVYPSTPAATGRRVVKIMGMPIDTLTERQTIARIMEALERGEGGWVITPNLDQLRVYCRQPSIRAMYTEAELVVPDGMPLVWASRFLGQGLPERVAGSNLIYPLSQAAAERGRSVFLLGGSPGAAEAAARKLGAIYPALKIAGWNCPPIGFENNPLEMARIQRDLAEARPDIVYVGLGFPKQERLIQVLRQNLPRTWFLGIGISLSFVGGQIRRAPPWMQRAGVEWAHRLWQEPRRLAYRYLVQDVPFAIELLLHALVARLKKEFHPDRMWS